ncbi:MAG TPA: type II secretion system F family protein [Pirellulales bacterium]|jgi:tight adherence protein B|nr:type II secretion system F family protein [Pirellulales bacterium]
MSPLLISLLVFIGVATLVGGVMVAIRAPADTKMETRLVQITTVATATKDGALDNGILSQPLDSGQDFFSLLVQRFGSLSLLFEQANTTLTPSKFAAITGILAVSAAAIPVLAGLSAAFIPLFGICAAFLPYLWLSMRKKRRLKKFGAQLPDALELMSRALRAGHSLQSGFHLVAEEMTAPIATEFGRVFEEQNLGIPMNDALDSMTARVPNLDLKFFVTAIVLQRQTGGDLAEILDKIGTLIRDRFRIWGQIQALTGEGRLSGIVLLALPPALFVAVYRLNPEYATALFTDPMGKKMLIFGILTQILGAVVIRKIINIKV